MTVSLNGYNEQAATFLSAAQISKGKSVKLSANMTVSETANGNAFIGFCLDCKDGIATVQLSGHYRAAYSGTAPTLGKIYLAADSAGGVKVGDSTGTSCLAVSVDTVNKTVDFIF
ncbi:hypothetical protein SDC9_148343 [bioreactor metagenome]|uniref:Uncharacterized protein n=1 Tax=bioreactor metagenome TaxID=1076179 RepID=A0A645EII6_9ZZZZ